MSEPESRAGDLQRLYPQPGSVSLEGLYLSQDLRACAPTRGAYVYSNFVSSLDGRIAVERSDGGLGVPQATANPRDWRLFLELAAPADALIVSGRLIRELSEGRAQAPPPFESGEAPDLEAFRRDQGMDPHPALVVLSRSLDLPEAGLFTGSDRRVILATTCEADAGRRRRLEALGAEVVQVGEAWVGGAALIEALAERGMKLIYSIAGPEVLHTLLSAGVIQRLYLTTVLRTLGGERYATLVHGGQLEPPPDFHLSALYLDRRGPGDAQQLMQVYDRAG